MTAHQQITDKLNELLNAVSPHISNGPEFAKAFDRFYGIDGAYELFVSDLYEALRARAA